MPVEIHVKARKIAPTVSTSGARLVATIASESLKSNQFVRKARIMNVGALGQIWPSTNRN
jgi:hypothetical protein